MKIFVVLALLVGLWLLLRPRPKKLATDRATSEARAVLGVGPDADAETIRAAHRRLTLGVHPDRGGSAELARRVNAARDLLLKR